jgi:hypothetical protein
MVDMSSGDEASAERVARPAPRGGRGRRLVAAATAAAVVLLVGGAVAYATAEGDDRSAAGSSPSGEHHGRRQNRGRGHEHPARSPYPERHDAATPDQRAAADALLTDVRATLAAYADVDAAVAAGYQAPRRDRARAGRTAAAGEAGRRRVTHYLHPGRASDGRVLDPALPEGLVYATPPEGGDGEPVLVGAFFVAPPGEEAPRPAGDLVVWHSHDRACPDLFVTDADPCLDTRRMLHVWTADQVTLVARRSGRATTVRITDPFGTPLDAAAEPVPR